MSVTETQLRQSVSQAIKQVMVKSKYIDEPLSFGQAVVTHHFLAQMQQRQPQPQSSIQQQSQITYSQQEPMAASQHLNMLSQSTGSPQKKGQTIQWDLIKQDDNPPEWKAFHGRKKWTDEVGTVKDAFQWNDGISYDTKKQLHALQQSPEKWKTENKDNFRYFIDPPPKKQNQEITGRALKSENYNISNIEGGAEIVQEIVLETETTQRQSPKQSKSKKRPLSAKQQKDKNLTKRLANLNSTTRWLPDSAFTTYFGKPAFHAYGKGNLNPTVGGTVYGQYMLTHNINPECGEHLPQFQQVFDNSLNKAKRINGGVRETTLPRKVSETIRNTPSEVQEQKARLPIMPKDRTINGKPQKSITILKPDLTKEKYFNSKHTTPNVSSIQDKSKKQLPAYQVPSKSNAAIINDHAKIMLQQIERDDLNLSIEDKPVVKVDHKQLQQDRNVNQSQEMEIADGQDIGDPDGQHLHSQEMVMHSRLLPLCQIPTTSKAPANELDPKNYQFVPACWTQRIRPAGRLTYKSEKSGNIIFQTEMESSVQATI